MEPTPLDFDALDRELGVFPLDAQSLVQSQLVPDQDMEFIQPGRLHEVPGSPVQLDADDQEDFSQLFDDEFHYEVFESNDCDDVPSNNGGSLMPKPEPVSIPEDGPLQSAPVPVARAEAKPKIQGDNEFKVIAPAKCKPLYSSPVDATDRAVQKLFPEWTLRLERSKFNRWRKKQQIRKLTPKENELLKRYRRTMLARVYADNARQRRTERAHCTLSEVELLRSENHGLRLRVAELERMLNR